MVNIVFKKEQDRTLKTKPKEREYADWFALRPVLKKMGGNTPGFFDSNKSRPQLV